MNSKSKKAGSSRDFEDAEYEVGFGKPPKNTRFKPGESGNPKGRKKGSRNFRTDVRKTLIASVKVSDGEGSRRMSTQEAALMRLREKALKGDPRSLDRLLVLAGTFNDDPDTRPEEDVSATDREIIEAFLARRNRPEGVDRSGTSEEAGSEIPPASRDATEEETPPRESPGIEEMLA